MTVKLINGAKLTLEMLVVRFFVEIDLLNLTIQIDNFSSRLSKNIKNTVSNFHICFFYFLQSESKIVDFNC